MGHLPWCMLYGLADFMAWVMEHIIRYRRKVILDNLSRSFPEMSLKDKGGIMHKFYRNFADFAFETIKMPHISAQEMKKRMIFENIEIYDSLVDRNISIAVYLAHIFNWEWGTSITLWINHELGKEVIFDQVYRPLRNKFFDSYFLKIRSTFGALSFKKATVFRDLLLWKRQGVPTVTGFLSDQKPSHGDPGLVVKFLNQPTAFITGTETVARRLKMAVIYWDMAKTSRGHYRITSHLICSDASEMAQDEITRQYSQLLQQNILRDPSLWLWSHRRWKHPVTYPSANPQSPQPVKNR